MRFLLLLCTLCFGTQGLIAQKWQQRVDYTMVVDFDAQKHQYTGMQDLWYFNHSPDTIDQAFYHLYYNAFRPGSVMDHYTQNVPDPDQRLQSIPALSPEQQGYLHVKSLTQDGAEVRFSEEGTILEVRLAKPLLPGDSTRLSMIFEGQVPVMIRRAGRASSEGIDYTMTQWYPKICAYDEDGWHPNPYIGREFYGDFGDFDVTISIDAKYTVGASGVLQNPEVVGRGYMADETVPVSKTGKIRWHFIAENVHDFAWAADDEYKHTSLVRHDGVVLHFFFRETQRNKAAWAALPSIMDYAMDYLNTHFGQYPYPVYSFIQGGDGGMEYPMATLITGERSLGSLVGVAVHELIHSWYQMVLATNESLYPWMDEGFTVYVTNKVMAELRERGFIPGEARNPDKSAEYGQYLQLVAYGIEEPMSTHADHFMTNMGYVISAYGKGSIFLSQLEYIIGEEAMARTMLRYFNTWKFRHPRPLDFIRVAEKESGMVLDWYYEYWILTTKTIDYAVSEVTREKKHTRITLTRSGAMPMPVEVEVRFRNGQTTRYAIPLDLMRGEKQEDPEVTILDDWQVTARDYVFDVPERFSNIESVHVDPDYRFADVLRENNVMHLAEQE